MIKHKYGKPIDPQRLKSPLLSTLKQTVKDYQETAEKLLSDNPLNDNSCFLCGNSDNRDVQLTYHGKIHYVRCPDCGHVYVDKRLSDAVIEEFYRSDQIWVDHYTNDEHQYRLENVAKPRVQFMLDYLNQENGSERFLDVGSGIGDTLIAAQELGFEAVGLEISESCIEFGKNKLGVDLRNSTMAQFAQTPEAGKFDAVSFFGVLDLVVDPMETLAHAVSLLNPKGVVGIFVPHFDSFGMSMLRTYPENFSRYSPAVDSPQQYTEKSLTYLMEKNGLTPKAFWWFGLDIMEFTNQLTLMCDNFTGSPAEKMLRENFNALQNAFDSIKASDFVMAVGQLD